MQKEIKNKAENSLRQIIGMAGVVLIGLSVGTFFYDTRTGVCLAIFLLGVGLLTDSLRK